MYQPVKPPAHLEADIRGLKYRVHYWGKETGLPVYLLHGWADTGMSFQFLADHLDTKFYLIAPDWRGFGDSQWAQGGYWIPDYLGDLEALIELLSPGRPVRLVGHSMGGNIAWLYAGIRPNRVSHAVSLDVYGLTDSDPDNAPSHYATWLDQLSSPLSFSTYGDSAGVVKRIRNLAPGLAQEEAEFLASQWSLEDEYGVYHLKHDPAHKRVNPILYRRREAIHCWQNITARALLVMAGDSTMYDAYQNGGYQAEIQGAITHLKEVVIAESGHMVHLDQPARLAAVLNSFLGD